MSRTGVRPTSAAVAGAALSPIPAVGRPELRLAGKALLAIGVLAVPVAVAAGVVEGVPGVVGALAGLGLVAVLFGASGAAMAFAARRVPSAMVRVAVIGFAVRLALYVAVLQVLGQAATVHRGSLAIATAVGVVVTLYYELRLISKTPQLFWVESDDARRGDVHDRGPLPTRRS